MEITLNKTNSNEGLIKIRLSEGDYQPHVEEKIKDYARKANIKGFRQGKVPTGVIKRMFGKSILVEEINHLLSHKVSDYIRENNLRIIGEPLPNLEKSKGIDWDTQKDYEFEYQIGMVEDFQYNMTSSAKVKGYRIGVDKKVLDETLQDVRSRFGNTTNPETSAIGDRLFGELTGTGDKSAFKKEYAFIPTDKVAKKEAKKFTNVKVGDAVEFEIANVFDDAEAISNLLDISKEDAAAASGTYKFTVTSISRSEPAEVNQELFDKVFGKDVVKSEDEFLSKVKETIAENYQRETNHFLDHLIEDYFIKNTQVSVPDSFLKTWLKATSNGEITDAVIEKEYDAYVRGLKWDLIKNKIADDNQIKVEADEVRDRAKSFIISQFGGPAIAEQLGDRLDAIAENYLQHENGKNFMRLFNELKSDKILETIKKNISIEEKEVSLDEFKKIVEEHRH